MWFTITVIFVACALTHTGLQLASGFGTRCKQVIQIHLEKPGSSLYKAENNRRRLCALIASSCALAGWILTTVVCLNGTSRYENSWFWVPNYLMQVMAAVYMMGWDTKFRKLYRSTFQK